MEEENKSTVPELKNEVPAQPEPMKAPENMTLKEEMQAAEAGLTQQESDTLKSTQQELIAKFLIIGCVWGIIIGALISKFLLGGTILSGVYSGIVVGMILGLCVGLLLGALEKAMLLQRVGKYAPKENEAQPDVPAAADPAEKQEPKV